MVKVDHPKQSQEKNINLQAFWGKSKSWTV
jgi:hypothetical protein